MNLYASVENLVVIRLVMCLVQDKIQLTTQMR